jgi:hypothetical protein
MQCVINFASASVENSYSFCQYITIFLYLQIPTSQSNAAVSYVQTNNGALGSLITEDGHLVLTGNSGALSRYSFLLCGACSLL